MARYYRCGEIIYSDIELSRQIIKKPVREINDAYDSGRPILINDKPIELAPVTEKDLPWLVGGNEQSRGSDGSIFCPFGTPIDLVAYQKFVEKKNAESASPDDKLKAALAKMEELRLENTALKNDVMWLTCQLEKCRYIMKMMEDEEEHRIETLDPRLYY